MMIALLVPFELKHSCKCSTTVNLNESQLSRQRWRLLVSLLKTFWNLNLNNIGSIRHFHLKLNWELNRELNCLGCLTEILISTNKKLSRGKKGVIETSGLFKVSRLVTDASKDRINTHHLRRTTYKTLLYFLHNKQTCSETN